MCAAFGNHCECITLLLAAGADRSIAMEAGNFFDASSGTTAVDLAAKKGHGEAVALLKPADASEPPPPPSTDSTADANDAMPTTTPTRSRLRRLSSVRLQAAQAAAAGSEKKEA